MRHVYLFLFVIVVTVAALGIMFLPQEERIREKTFNAVTHTLDNGLKVVVIPNNRAPVVTHMVWYKAGAADEPEGKSGIAHFMEHLMFKGSGNLAPGEFSRKVRALGGNDNAFTSRDFTAYFQSIATRHLRTVMEMEAGRMQGMTVPEGEVMSERQVIIEERRQRTDNNPSALLREQAMATLFVNHPYGDPVIGWMSEMEDLTRQDAVDFHKKFYAPNNAYLIISGDIAHEDAFLMAKETYGKIPARETPERNWTVIPPLTGNTRVKLSDAKVRQPEVTIYALAPNFRENKAASLALDIASEILGGGKTSRLYRALVVDQKLASSAGFYYSGSAVGPGSVQFYADPLPGISPETVEAALMQTLNEFVQSGPTEEEVSDAIIRLQNAAIYSRDSLQGPAMIFGRSLTTGMTIDDIEYWPYDLAGITQEDVATAAKKHLDFTRTVTSYLLPEEVSNE